jgi:hypothetical protein
MFLCIIHPYFETLLKFRVSEVTGRFIVILSGHFISLFEYQELIFEEKIYFGANRTNASFAKALYSVISLNKKMHKELKVQTGKVLNHIMICVEENHLSSNEIRENGDHLLQGYQHLAKICF